ncbi:prepilin-type N-terminal cleavage/methylation domain-containing protein [Azospirillum sp. ST 5-10]|uniref:prepilin-type N-terminal cleavage/methylation domain-containing protein n=1 Tax=unclassified Azospirillum TaxID=2630922 RepID=UPI003F4A7BC0
MRTAAGFTLLELLIAATVLGLLMAVLAGGLHFGLAAWRAGERRADAVEAPAAVQALLRERIERAYPLSRRRGEPAILFEGGRERLRLVTVLPARLGVPGLADVTLFRGDDATLRLAWQPLGGDQPAASATLLEGVSDLAFAYYGGDTRVAPARWRDDWLEAGFLPGLVRLSLRLADGRPWPDLVAAPAVTVDSLLE